MTSTGGRGSRAADRKARLGSLRDVQSRCRVLFVINSLAGGGAERVMTALLNHSEGWAGRHDVALAVLDVGPQAFRLPEWLQTFQLNCRGGTLASIAAIDRLVRDYRPDATLSFLTRANVASGIAMGRRNRSWIISERTSAPAHLGTALRKLATKAVMRILYPRAARVIAVSAGVASKLSRKFGVRSDRIEVIPNPVDIRAIEAAARKENDFTLDGPYVMALGRLVSVKNYALLIEAFAMSGLPCRLVIAGGGPERESLKKLAASLGLADRLVLPGWLDNPYPALRSAHVFALSSNVEGFPNALVEALALGIPSVATNCPDGPSEILAGCSVAGISGLTVAQAGILTPVGDVNSYAKALGIAFDEPLRRRLTESGRARVRHYSATSVVERYWSLIEAELRRSERSTAT